MTPPRPAQVRIGAGAGFSGDRIDPAVELARSGDLDFLVFECLAERTIALAQAARSADPAAGYDPGLAARLRAVLPLCADRGVRIITNMGAANPRGAADHAASIARELGLAGLRIAAVSGDDVLGPVIATDPPVLGGTQPLSSLVAGQLLSANAYLGADPIVDALDAGAQLVITGRVADPSLFVGPLRHAFGWRADDWTRLGRATAVGHLLECAGQLTGGYFADPGVKDVPGLARLGFPWAEVTADGDALLGKVEGSGGRLDVRTCTEQLLYELNDPRRYLTPDVTADFSNIRFEAVSVDRVSVSGGAGAPAPRQLKVSVGYHDGFRGEGQISYGGPGAEARGQLALEIIRERLRMGGEPVHDVRYDLIGLNAVAFGSAADDAPAEVRARVAGRADTLEAAQRIGAEVEALFTNGPAGGGGVATRASAVVAIASVLIPRAWAMPRFDMVVA